METLDAVAVRVLGSLIEKAFTTPDNYPLTLNALTAACNQTSNRDPVMQLDEAAVQHSLDELARQSLARGVLRSDSRVKRFRHLLEETLHLHPAEMAALCVLLLRGPQTTGEIRTRTTRLFDFSDLAQVEITLQSLMALSPPLVSQLPRRPGQKETRFAHLLAGAVDASAFELADTDSTEHVDRLTALERTVATLQTELAGLQREFNDFRRSFG